MLTSPTTGRRISGRIMVVATIAVALPLTATRAIQYVDVPVAPSAVPAAAPVEAVQNKTAAVVPAAQRQPIPSVNALAVQDDGKLMIDGEEKNWGNLTPAEKAEVRRSLVEAREELRRVNREEIQRNARETLAEARINQEEFRREMAEARAEVAAAMREIDAHAAEIRRSGQDPEQIKATVRASLRAVETIDVEAITRQAMASVDPAQMDAALVAAEAGLAKAEAEIERLERSQDRQD